METLSPGARFKFNTRRFEIDYDKGPKVGYKWYDAEGKQPLFPFGYGLSYTTYAYSGLEVTSETTPAVRFRVKNAGSRAGAEIAQVYVSLPEAAGEPFKRLVAWARVQLAPDEAQTITLALDPHYLSVFNADQDAWELVPADYRVYVGGSSRATPFEGRFRLGSDRAPSLQGGYSVAADRSIPALVCRPTAAFCMLSSGTIVAVATPPRRGVSPDTAMCLRRYFISSARSWLSAQAAYDLEVPEHDLRRKIGRDVGPLALLGCVQRN